MTAARNRRQVEYIPRRAFNAVMAWTIRDDLWLTIRLGLTKGLNLIHGMRRKLNEDERDRVADTIAEHLLRANYRIEPGEPAEGHGPQLMTPKAHDRGRAR